MYIEKLKRLIIWKGGVWGDTRRNIFNITYARSPLSPHKILT